MSGFFRSVNRRSNRLAKSISGVPVPNGEALPAEKEIDDMSEPSDFGTFGRYIETPVGQMSPEMRDAYDFTIGLRGLVPGPHRIWLANPKLSNTIVPTGAYYQKHSTLTKAEIEIVTNLITARWLSAYASYAQEKIGEAQGRLPAETVERIIAGLPVSFEDAREEIVYQIASALVTPRLVPLGLYRRAKTFIGNAGIVGVTVLIGWFTMVSATLSAFDVPANAVGLDQ
jgi:4-carboxymuconolactone decarboxylase